MKKIICCIVVIIIAATTFSQSTTPSLALTKQDYLRKGRSQNTIAWFLIAGGVTTATIGYAIQTKEVLDFGNIFSGSEAKSSNTGDIVGYTGLGIMLSSIPFFISAHKNKKKALSLSFQNEKALYFQDGNFVTFSVPSLSIKISL